MELVVDGVIAKIREHEVARTVVQPHPIDALVGPLDVEEDGELADLAEGHLKRDGDRDAEQKLAAHGFDERVARGLVDVRAERQDLAPLPDVDPRRMARPDGSGSCFAQTWKTAPMPRCGELHVR